MKIWKLGIVGAGLIADFHARALQKVPNARLTACCDSVFPKAEKLAAAYGCQAFDDYQSMLAEGDVDIVTIATPSGLHMEPVVAAAEAGKHVLCEKPLDVTLERIDRMIAAHRASGTRLGGIFPFRYNDFLGPLRAALSEGRFGTVTYASASVPWWRNDDYYVNSWHGTWKMDGGGALMNQSIHVIDLLCDLMPPVESVLAYAATLAHPAMETEDTASAVLRFRGGALGAVYGTTASWPGRLRRVEITGTNGTVECVEDSFASWRFADERPQDSTVRGTYGKPAAKGGTSDPAAIDPENHTRNFAAFLDALDGNTPFNIDGPSARKSVALILAMYRSARERAEVRL